MRGYRRVLLRFGARIVVRAMRRRGFARPSAAETITRAFTELRRRRSFLPARLILRRIVRAWPGRRE